ncbi:LON peptidase N-terminal domain and RING finger protein 1 isoform X1 [Sesamum indicum]|uniref:LON peptidase N-terminal domain and RING finger protein 1 isoform X1 n=1 Tax=Sesamum indicum TaxID=4182 RepID=A0A6I9SS63_SESIN|nr:LON peptidase N-terminal domain and RING finger protein 1 isoform X1 [Sesamum indicum]
MASSFAPEFSLAGIDDVQDFPWQSGEGSSMSWERYKHLCDLMQLGNKAFRENRLDQAIEFYSRANNIKPGDPIILSNRCAAYLRISQFLKHRPPSASEYRPLSGLDPTTHAGLALKDAEKVMSLQSNLATSYILKANALILLEKYELARDVICSGLQIDPQNNSLLNLDRSTANTFTRRNHIKPQRTDDYDCTLCLKLLYEPITTPCGHSFCRSCLFQSMDRGNRCPLCRTVLFISPRTSAISVTLNNIIQKNFPEEYAERKSEHDSLTFPGVDLLPLFVMDVILPCQKFQLNIFEPRYRLMVRRIMEGNRRMGMAVIDSSSGSIADYACEVEITDCEPLPDGRFFLEVESRRRCHIIRNWDQDGYRIAEVEWVEDSYPPEGAERDDLLDMTNKAAAFARQWIKDAQEAAQGDRIRLAELFKAEGMMPTTRDPERFSFWLATLTNRRPSERLDLLRIRDTKERIRRALLYMKAEEQGCRLQ